MRVPFTGDCRGQGVSWVSVLEGAAAFGLASDVTVAPCF